MGGSTIGHLAVSLAHSHPPTLPTLTHFSLHILPPPAVTASKGCVDEYTEYHSLDEAVENGMITM